MNVCWWEITADFDVLGFVEVHIDSFRWRFVNEAWTNIDDNNAPGKGKGDLIFQIGIAGRPGKVLGGGVLEMEVHTAWTDLYRAIAYRRTTAKVLADRFSMTYGPPENIRNKITPSENQSSTNQRVLECHTVWSNEHGWYQKYVTHMNVRTASDLPEINLILREHLALDPVRCEALQEKCYPLLVYSAFKSVGPNTSNWSFLRFLE